MRYCSGERRDTASGFLLYVGIYFFLFFEGSNSVHCTLNLSLRPVILRHPTLNNLFRSRVTSLCSRPIWMAIAGRVLQMACVAQRVNADDGLSLDPLGRVE